MSDKSHWEAVYSRNAADAVSWYQQQATRSGLLITKYCQLNQSHVIDIGAGASVLADTLLATGVKALTLTDLAEAALAVTKKRLGDAAQRVHWLHGDILQTELAADTYDVWHDRAVFHFMISTAQRQAYLTQLHKALKPGGLVVIATFATDGPERCSGLPVCRYDAQSLAAEFGPAFEILETDFEMHQTPSGKPQSFLYMCFRKKLR